MEGNNVMWGAGSRRGSLFVCWGSLYLRQGARRTWFSFAVKFSASLSTNWEDVKSPQTGAWFFCPSTCAWASLIAKANCIQSISIFGEDNSCFFVIWLRFFFSFLCFMERSFVFDFKLCLVGGKSVLQIQRTKNIDWMIFFFFFYWNMKLLTRFGTKVRPSN